MRRAVLRVLCGLAATAAFTLAAVPPMAARAAEGLEYPVKAAFLVNFLKFVDWPAARWPAAGRPIVLGVLGSDEMLDALAQVAGHEQVRGHAVEVKRLASAQGFSGQILYAGGGARSDDVAAAEREGLLVVGESESTAPPGAVIRFFLKERNVHFEVSLAAARRAGLSFSSRLLKVARVVDREESR